jgi:hypothetical protein
MGHGEFFRAQLNSQSSEVVTTPGSNFPSSKLISWLLSIGHRASQTPVSVSH